MGKKILVTAGSTYVPIDKVRGITNIFKGRTGTEIALHLAKQGYEVTLLTSNPHLVDRLLLPFLPRLLVRFLVFIRLVKVPIIVKYWTYDELMKMMNFLIMNRDFDAIVHSSAVSDYYVDNVYVEEEIAPDACGQTRLVPIDKDSKISSDHPRLYLGELPTEKIIDKIRRDWGFKKLLVKFKLQVDMSEEELLNVAHNSMKHSQADVIVANCLEWSKDRAIIIADSTPYLPEETTIVKRSELPIKLEQEMELIWSSQELEQKINKENSHE